MNRLRGVVNFKLVALHINLGIDTYSKISEEIVRSVCRSLGINLVVVNIKELIGFSIPEMAKKVHRSVCSICGLVKRYVMNASAIELGADSIATGHNMDDLIANIVKEFLNMNIEGLVKLVPRTESIDGIAIGRIRPFYETSEMECLLYSLLNELPFIRFSCPYIDLSGIDRLIKKYINDLDYRHPGIKVSFIRKFVKNIPLLSSHVSKAKIMKCDSCGLISQGDECSFCKLTRRLVGKPLGFEIRRYLREVSSSIKW